jgi:hypothetical protein
MVVSIQGRRMYLWRAVDSEGEVLAREWVLGGATLEMLERSEFPIPMAH